MPDPRRPTDPPRTGDPPDTSAPDVLVDFLVDGDSLLLSLRNFGSGAAHDVRVGFEPGFHGLGGELDVPGLALFSRLRFLAPHREIRVLVDSLARYFARGEPEVLEVTVTFSDRDGRKYHRRLGHDLGIYRDLPAPGAH